LCPIDWKNLKEKAKMTNEELFAGSAVNSWKQIISRLDKMFSAIRDEDLKQPIAPGRNRVVYLLGHLTAVHDRMLPLLALGERMHPELDAAFLDNPDGPAADAISPAVLRKAWIEVNSKLTTAFEALKPAQWLEKHTAVSDEDFAKEPHRNRLSVLLSRTNHASFHSGQIRLTQ
jgi:hypothetical protein